MNPYSELGVPPSASEAEIKAAYRAAAQKAHPDREGGSAEAMSRLNQAYNLLSDKRRKARFDATGEEGLIDPDSEAHKLLAEAIMHEAEQNPDRDLIRALHVGFSSMQRQVHEKSRAEQCKLANVERSLKRLRWKGKRIDIMQLALEERRTMLKHSLARMEHSASVLKRVLEILRDYDYDWSPAKGAKPSIAMPTFEDMAKYFNAP